MVLARNPDRLAALVRKGWIPFGPGDGLREVTPWTDDYINILLPLRDGMRERWDGFNFAQWLKSLRP